MTSDPATHAFANQECGLAAIWSRIGQCLPVRGD
ncbi:MAG: hypothetical protein QOD12_2573 [Verrucomicrobiota bacterium]